MWQAVRRELVRLEWDATPPTTDDVLADWSRTVASVLAVRQELGPVSVEDPIALLATATTGAARTRGAEPSVAVSLDGVRAALDEVAQTITSDAGATAGGDVATLNLVAYELAHRVRVQVTDERVGAWLLAGETALDAAIHAPVTRSATAAGLAGWHDALAAVQPVAGAAIVRRSVTLGHLAILRDAYTLVQDAKASGDLPPAFSDSLLGQLRELAVAHQTTLRQVNGVRLGSTKVDQAVMLTVGVAVRRLTGRPDVAEPPLARLDALLRSGFGGAVLVANITRDPAAAQPAAALNRAALEYVANPAILRPADPPQPSPPPVGPAGRTPTELRAPAAVASPGAPGQPTIRPGTVLSGPAVVALCRARDLGVAAANSDAADPPELLRGIDPARWPQRVVEGRQALTDLVASVIPMVYAQTRQRANAADLRGQMFVELMGAAVRFDPQRIGPERWPTYAWVTLEHSRWRGVDASGTARKRFRSPRPDPLPLEGREVVSRAHAPGDALEQRQSVAAITGVLNQLPDNLRDPLLASMQGHTGRAIGDDLQYSESTARRRLAAARDQVREGLAGHDRPDGTGKSVTDPVLERSQRLFEQTFGPTPSPEPRRGPSR